MNCPYCGAPSTDVPAHAEDRHGITPEEAAKHRQAAGPPDLGDTKRTRSGLIIPADDDEPGGQYL